MYVPITSKGKPIGLLYLGSFRVGGFSTEDMHTADSIANQMGVALETRG